MKLNELTIKQAQEGLAKKEFSSMDLVEACFKRIKEAEPKIHAFLTVSEKEAREEAKKARTKRAEDYPLLGIPISVKDNYCTRGIKTTAASQVLENYIPPYDATVIKKLKAAGAIILGKTNMDAWAHGSSTETSDFGPTYNPWDTSKLPGGSSGGSAASIAADEIIGSIGSETAGSIRQPASWCGVVGFKPTYGRVSRYGLIAMASSTDSPGPLTKTVEDAAILLQVLAGKDEQDATTSSKEVPNYLANINNSIKGLRIGISEDYFKVCEPQVKEIVLKAIKALEESGAQVKNLNLFNPKYAISVYTILQRSEVSSNLARFDGIRYGEKRDKFQEEAKRRIMLGTYCLSAGYYNAYYLKAQKIRTLICKDFEEAFKNVDVIIGPTTPSTALPVGSSKNHPMFGEVADMLVEPSTIAGLPGVNVNCGFTKENLPVGMQIMGPQFSEDLILRVANFYQQATDWYKRKPKL